MEKDLNHQCEVMVMEERVRDAAPVNVRESAPPFFALQESNVTCVSETLAP